MCLCKSTGSTFPLLTRELMFQEMKWTKKKFFSVVLKNKHSVNSFFKTAFANLHFQSGGAETGWEKGKKGQRKCGTTVLVWHIDSGMHALACLPGWLS